MKRRTAIVTALAAAAILAPAAMPASAGKVTHAKLKITTLNASGAIGKLKSKQPACSQNRKVKVLFSGEYTPVTVGSDKTDRHGRWGTTKAISDSGAFYATTKAVKRGKVKCAAETSKVVHFTQ
jgi:hypothetical protein